jgi:hypothetical protein
VGVFILARSGGSGTSAKLERRTTMATTTWDYEGYWNVVLGANRDADSVVEEFGLVDTGLDEWLRKAESEAWRHGGDGCSMPPEWAGFHDCALKELRFAKRVRVRAGI